MATFHIHEDAEKENPQMPAVLKEKTLSAGGNRALPFQPSVLGGAILPVKGKLTDGMGRTTMAVLNANSNNGHGRKTAGGMVGSKVAFREVGNAQIHNDNAEILAAAATNKKNFTVASLAYADDECVFESTPMSVSEGLSPMSVDRSLASITKQSEVFEDDNDDRKVADLTTEEEERKRHLLIPRNDRQRFFEVVEYQRNILEYFLESEKKHRPKPYYMRRQADINHSMRTILVDWLVEVSEEYNLDTETLYLSVSYIDRFLSQMSVVRSKLQLVGTAAMFIASKYEEIYPPDVGEFVFITDDTYNKAQVLRMEQIILKILAFDLCTPTAYVFVSTYATLLDMTDRLKFLTQYICELSLLEADPYLRFLPSLISAAAHALARHLLDYTIWTVELEELTSYSLEDLKEVLLHLCKSHNAATKLPQQAIQEKYKTDKYKKVSTIKPIELDEEAFELILGKNNELQGISREEIHEKPTSRTHNEHIRRTISLMFN